MATSELSPHFNRNCTRQASRCGICTCQASGLHCDIENVFNIIYKSQLAAARYLTSRIVSCSLLTIRLRTAANPPVSYTLACKSLAKCDCSHCLQITPLALADGNDPTQITKRTRRALKDFSFAVIPCQAVAIPRRREGSTE